MKETLELKNSIKINGKMVKKLTYDLNEITPELFAEAEAKKNASAKTVAGLAKACELDYSFHFQLGVASILAVNPEYAAEDLDSIKGHDLYEVLKIGRSFFKASEESEEEKGTGGTGRFRRWTANR